jgi:hypothetical protein
MLVVFGLVMGVAFAAAEAMKCEGVVKSMGEGKLVVTAGEKDMTFETNKETKIADGVKVGAKVVVMYKKDGEKMVAQSVEVAK